MDTDGVRANMTASWLAQMAWDVYVLDGVDASEMEVLGAWTPTMPQLPTVQQILAGDLADLLNDSDDVILIDLSKRASFIKGHIPGSWHILRSRFEEDAKGLPRSEQYVLTCADGALSCFAAAEISSTLKANVFVLEGGNDAWVNAGFPLDEGSTNCLSPILDRYKRPYEGMDNKKEAMQAYLDWEFGLIEQLGRDGTHHFWVLEPQT